VIVRSRHSVAALLTIWLGIILVVNLLSLPKTWPNSLAPVAVLTLAMLAFGAAFVAFGRLLARDEGPALLDFISQTTRPEDVPAELRPSC
jgi:hypothetical protein